jgi:hypothetical protein
MSINTNIRNIQNISKYTTITFNVLNIQHKKNNIISGFEKMMFKNRFCYKNDWVNILLTKNIRKKQITYYTSKLLNIYNIVGNEYFLAQIDKNINKKLIIKTKLYSFSYNNIEYDYTKLRSLGIYFMQNYFCFLSGFPILLKNSKLDTFDIFTINHLMNIYNKIYFIFNITLLLRKPAVLLKTL